MQSKITLKIRQTVQLVCLVVFLAFSFNKTMAQGTLTTTYTPGSGLAGGNDGIAFDIQNTNATARLLTDVAVYWNPATTAGATTAKLWMTSTPASLSGGGTISAAGGWTAVTGYIPLNITAAGIIPTFTGLNITLAANTQYRFAVESTNGIAYGAAGTTPNSFTADGVALQVGDYQVSGASVGYAMNPMPNFLNNPRFFAGSITWAIATACAGTPTPGNTVSTVTGSCPGVGFTLSSSTPVAPGTTGITYQWQSSATGAPGSYSNIGGATSATYTTTQATATYYQLVVTCANGGGVGTSTPLLLPLATACYCNASGLNSAGGTAGTTNVTFAGINQNSAATAPYENHLNDTATVIKGGTYAFSVTIPTAYSDMRIHAWIDYNGDGDWVDAGEDVFTFSSSVTNAPLIITGNITIPTTAITGLTRLRIRYDAYDTPGANNTPCGTSDYGQVEDYTVKIVPCVPTTLSAQPTDQSVTCAGSATFTATADPNSSFPVYQWEYRTSSSGLWLNVPNAAPYSGVNTTTLTVNPATASMNGYQYRLLYSGLCAGATPSNAATLTVNQIVATVTPATATICTGTTQQITLNNTLGNSNLLNEGFDSGVPGTWTTINRSTPAGTTNWAQGDATTFTAHSGAGNSYVESDYQAAAVGVNNTISNWLITPVISIKNGDLITFWTRIPTLAQSGGVEYPDRLEVRVSTNGASTNVGATATSTGDFTNLLLTINPTQVTGVYPMAWTQFTATVSGVTGTLNGRVAFRAFETDNGSGANEDYIGLDDVVYTSTGAPATGVFTGPAGTIFTNAAGTTPYTGTPATTVYVTPAVGTSTYSVNFTTPGTGCVSSTATSVITVNSVATGTPAVANVTTCAGTPAVFTVTGITGGTGLTYQWQVSTLAVPAFTNISGATSSTYTVAAPTAAQNGNKYRVIVGTGGCTPTLTSTAGTLTVNPIPVVTISAAPVVNIFPGLTSTLTAAVSSATSPLSYQWYLNGSPIAGATSNTYVVSVDGEGKYTVKVSDANGCTSAAGTSTPNFINIGDSSGVTILFIYPSPNSGRFQVRYFNDINNAGTAPAVVNVYDEKGARVFTQRYVLGAGYNAMNVDLGTHGRGLYRVELLDLNENRIKTGSVMVF